MLGGGLAHFSWTERKVLVEKVTLKGLFKMRRHQGSRDWGQLRAEQ